VSEWKKVFLDLRAKGRIVDPKVTGGIDITAKVANDEYEVPTIDNAPKDKGPVKKINKRTTDLVQILSF
jgi:hypothetical protein